MFCGSLTWFTCVSMAVATALNYREGGSTTVSGPDVTVYRLRTDNPATAASSGTTTDAGATQPLSDDASTAASAAPPLAACPSSPLNDTAVSLLRSLSAEEKGEKLIRAAEEGAVVELRSLLAAGADAGATRRGGSWTALHYAADRGDAGAASCLIGSGAQVDARSGWQLTPLHYAAANGHTAVVRLLLASSASHSARNDGGWTPLHFAARDGHAEIAAMLLQAGADKAARDKYGQTPLDIARRNNRQQQLLDMLRSN